MKKVIIAEKPSVAKNIADAIKATNRKNGYIEGNDYVITWVFGHLLQLYDAKDYDPILKSWRLENFPFVPSEFKYKIKNDGKDKTKVDEGARISDLIKLAGGLKSNASTKYLNLSKKLEDEMVIKIYTETQIKNMNINYKVQEECICSSDDITGCAGANVIINGSSNSNNEVIGKISLNKASMEELMTLSGVGESKAKDIIEYRNKNNGFKTVEEIMNVSGIGEALYNKIKDNITL